MADELTELERKRRLREIFQRAVYAPARLEPQLELAKPLLVDIPAFMRGRAAQGQFGASGVRSPRAGEGSRMEALATLAGAIAKSACTSPAVTELEGVGPGRELAAAAAASPFLVQTRVELPPPSKSLDVRRLRALVHNHVRKLHPKNSNLRKCSERRYALHVDAKVRGAGETQRGFVTGVVRCASVHSCPRCAARISSERAEQVKTVVKAHRALGGEAYMLTLTVPHDVQMRCRRLRRQVSEAWQLMQRGAGWKRLKGRMRFVGSITSREITHGGNGWHPHLHILLATRRPLSDDERYQLEVSLFTRWVDAVERVPGLRLEAPSWEHGISLVPCHDESYIEKLGLADELLRALHKRGRGGNRTPFEIMADYARAGGAGDAALFREYARGMKGARQLTWSRGKAGATDLRKLYAAELRALAGDVDQPELELETDAQLIERQEREGVVAREIPGRTWDALVRVMRRAGGDADSAVAAAAEEAGAIGVDALIARAWYVGRELAKHDRKLRRWLPWLEPRDPL